MDHAIGKLTIGHAGAQMKDDTNVLSLYVTAAAQLQDLVLDPDCQAEVEQQFYLLKSMAQKFLDFSLSEELEPAAIFRP